MKKGDEGVVERIISFVEKDRVGILKASFILFVIAYLRSYLESWAFRYYGVSIYLRANHVALDFALFIVGVVIITAASGLNARKVFNVVLFGWPIILIPPIIDYLTGFSQYGKGYTYSSNLDFVGAFLMFFDVNKMAEIGWGEFIQLWGIIILSSLYVFIRKRSAIRSILTGLGLLSFMAYISISLSLILHIDINSSNQVEIVFFRIWHSPINIMEYYSYLTPLVNAGSHPTFREYFTFNFVQQGNLLLALYYTTMFLIFAGIYMYLSNKIRFKEFIKMSNLPFLMLIGFISFIGAYINPALHLEYAYHFIYAAFAVIAAVSGAQVWIMLEHLSSDKWTARTFGRKEYRNVALAFSALSTASAYLLGTGPFLLAILFIFLAYVYSCKPFYAKKTLSAPLVQGIAGALAFLLGFYTPSYWLIVTYAIGTYDPSQIHEIRIPANHPLDNIAIAMLLISTLAGIIYYFIMKKKGGITQ